MITRAVVAARLSSVDTFRGLTMAGMVIVNNPGTWDAMYWPLAHAEWDGWTPTDLIFPFFVFLVGVSLTLSNRTLTAAPWRIGRRAAIIILLGLFIAGFPFFDPHHWRIPGVLQRIGICYLAAAFVYRAVQPNRACTRAEMLRSFYVLGALVAVILVVYWIVLTAFGDLTHEGNAGARIDRALMGGHLWRERWDPEGLLSTLPAIGTALLGVMTGLFLVRPVANGGSSSGLRRTRDVAALAVIGAALFLAGQAWHVAFPINKQLWTSSYVLLTGGGAMIVLAACMYLIDIRGVRAWSRPFVVLGRNAITLFVVSGLIGKLLILINVPNGDGSRTSLQWVIYERGFAWIASPRASSLLYALVFLAVMYLICDALHRQGIFLRA